MGVSAVEWVAASGTAVGAVVAAIAVVYAKRAFHSGQKQEARRQDEEQSRQARSVSAWIEVDEPTREYEQAPTPAHAGLLLVKNSSDAPVYGVYVQLMTVPRDDDAERHVRLPVLAPGATVEKLLGDYMTFDPVNPHTGRLHLANGYGLSDYRAAVSFTDSGGQRWTRGSQGRLRRSSPEA